jgi:hypothetical protein
MSGGGRIKHLVLLLLIAGFGAFYMGFVWKVCFADVTEFGPCLNVGMRFAQFVADPGFFDPPTKFVFANSRP